MGLMQSRMLTFCDDVSDDIDFLGRLVSKMRYYMSGGRQELYLITFENNT